MRFVRVEVLFDSRSAFVVNIENLVLLIDGWLFTIDIEQPATHILVINRGNRELICILARRIFY